jgi:rhodanese-related sulfurtransferase
MKHLRLSAISAALALCALAAASLACSAGAEPGDATQTELVARLDAGQAPPLVLDVRTPEEFAAGHVPGARNIPIDELDERIGEIAAHRDQEVVVYCETGRRAGKASDALGTAGFTQVRQLDGDMRAWREAGLPVE